MLTPELERELLDYYDNELKAEVEAFTRNVAETLKGNKRVMDEVRPLVVSRMKTRASLKRKLRMKFDSGGYLSDYPLSTRTLIEYVQDLGGVRVIVHDRANIDRMVSILMDKVDRKIWRHFRTKLITWDRDTRKVEEGDDLNMPRVEVELVEDGSYRSRHITIGDGDRSSIRCEVQFRSVIEEAMFEAHHRLIYRLRQKGMEPVPAVEQTLIPLTEMFASADELVSDCYRWTEDHLNEAAE